MQQRSGHITKHGVSSYWKKTWWGTGLLAKAERISARALRNPARAPRDVLQPTTTTTSTSIFCNPDRLKPGPPQLELRKHCAHHFKHRNIRNQYWSYLSKWSVVKLFPLGTQFRRLYARWVRRKHSRNLRKTTKGSKSANSGAQFFFGTDSGANTWRCQKIRLHIKPPPQHNFSTNFHGTGPWQRSIQGSHLKVGLWFCSLQLRSGSARWDLEVCSR